MPSIALPLIGGVVVVALLGLGLLIAFALRRVVQTNMIHIVQSGKKTTSYGKGQAAGSVYYEIPAFIPLFGVQVTRFAISNFRVALDNYNAFDLGRLPFVVDIVAFFSIFDSDMAATRVSSFEELMIQLQDILRGSVRRVLSEHKLEEILGMRSELGQTFTAQVEGQLKEWGVRPVKTIEFMDMRDHPPSNVIHDIMAKDQARIERESRVAIAENMREAQEREIEATRQVDLQKQEALRVVGERTAVQEKAVGIAREQSRQEVLAESKITAERDMEVRQVQQVRTAEIERSVAEVRAAQDKNVAVINAEAAKQAMVVNAEGEKLQISLVSEGNLAQAQNDAQGVEAMGVARAEAERRLLMAPVDAQITLAKEIGSNDNYQAYLVRIENIKASQNVGIELAKSIGNADIKIIANSNDVQSGMTGVGDMFTARGGTNLTGMLAALAQTEPGAALVERITGHSSDDAAPPPKARAKRVPTANGAPA